MDKLGIGTSIALCATIAALLEGVGSFIAMWTYFSEVQQKWVLLSLTMGDVVQLVLELLFFIGLGIFLVTLKRQQRMRRKS